MFSRNCQARLRASGRAARIAARAFSPETARVWMRRETVGSGATGPNMAGSTRSMSTSARQSPPNATARATSRGPSRDHVRPAAFATVSAPRISPGRGRPLRTVSTSRTEPTYETTWRPSPWTRTRGYDAVSSLTWKVLFPSQPTGHQPADRPPRESARLRCSWITGRTMAYTSPTATSVTIRRGTAIRRHDRDSAASEGDRLVSDGAQRAASDACMLRVGPGGLLARGEHDADDPD